MANLTARRLVPIEGTWAARKIHGPRCEAPRESGYHNDTPKTDKRCRHSALYVLGDNHLCARHAGIFALRYLLTQTGPEPIEHHQV